MSRRVALLLWICVHATLALDDPIIEDSDLNTLELLEKYGYPAENHTVQTEDDYFLNIHRIPRPNAKPVLLMHGLLDSSATWVIMGPEKGLGYWLYDQGYDVWMGNVRGNTYCRKHASYTPDDSEFWDFSFHEIGIFDLPKIIDHVLEQTDSTQLHYIGHSQGTTSFWIMGSERPEYMEKIQFMQALAPVAFFKDCKSPPLNFLGATPLSSTLLLQMLGANEFLPQTEFTETVSAAVCDGTEFGARLCSNTLFLFTGFDKEQLNETMLPTILGHAPAGASTKQILHFGQMKSLNDFRKYDYGPFENQLRYKNFLPPKYKLENVNAKVALYYGLNDWLAQPGDVTTLYFKLPNVQFKYLVDYPKFNHLDFMWGIDARELLYNRMLESMRYYENEQEINL
ncbi:lipase 3 [Drosophila virilis]|uniref:Lipase n=1 Tax=Drosophila virilis TaxID=7244 RepID=B4LUK9_DROVI|nr:lipase 3 [Drosophila virilis]XP_015028777.1 lipase 3 [Drosophila virilis]EDW64195.2 uncharacterized protein Dvir_GJ23834, isoform A [Drosophila virilis]KRF81489.1 uncharacterized protein Dvir_GJ23834, isoform B [Drosophila virilis]